MQRVVFDKTGRIATQEEIASPETYENLFVDLRNALYLEGNKL